MNTKKEKDLTLIEKLIYAFGNSTILKVGGISAYTLYLVALLLVLFTLFGGHQDEYLFLRSIILLLVFAVVLHLSVNYFSFLREKNAIQFQIELINKKYELARERNLQVINFLSTMVINDKEGFGNIFSREEILFKLLKNMDDVYNKIGFRNQDNDGN